MFKEKILSPATNAAIILVILGLTSVFVYDFVLHKTISTPGVTILLIIVLLIFLALPSSLMSRFSEIKFWGLELKTRINEVEQEMGTLRKQMYAIGHTAIVQQVNSLNRLAIENPDLAQKVWKKMENLKAEEIRYVSYAYAFIDIFDMIRRFKEDEPLAKELFITWQKEWMPDLLNSETGKLLQENKELMSYYSSSTRQALGLEPLKPNESNKRTQKVKNFVRKKISKQS